MKTKIMLSILVIVLVSGIGITASIISIDRPNTIFNFNQTTKDILNHRLDLGIDDITEYLGETVCDIDVCKTPFIKKDSIDTVIQVPARYCSKWLNETTMDECLAYTPYTTEEIKLMTDDKIENRLLGIADAEAHRKTKSEQEKDVIIDKGKTTTTTGVEPK